VQEVSRGAPWSGERDQRIAKGGGGADGSVAPSVRPAGGPSADGPACGPNSWATRGSSFVFLFLFMPKMFVCLNLNGKSCDDSKIKRIFV